MVTALALTPAAMSKLANVCRHSWRPIGSSTARRHAVKARLRTAVGVNVCVALEPKTKPLSRRHELVLDEEVAERGDDRHAAPAGAALRLSGFPVAGHAALDPDQSAHEINIAPLQGPEFPAAQAGVERAAP